MPEIPRTFPNVFDFWILQGHFTEYFSVCGPGGRDSRKSQRTCLFVLLLCSSLGGKNVQENTFMVFLSGNGAGPVEHLRGHALVL